MFSLSLFELYYYIVFYFYSGAANFLLDEFTGLSEGLEETLSSDKVQKIVKTVKDVVRTPVVQLPNKVGINFIEMVCMI